MIPSNHFVTNPDGKIIPMADIAKGNEGLRRELGILDVTVNVVNTIIGSGIFLLPAIISGILGNASILAYLFCGILYLMVVLCLAEAGSRFTTSGGMYTYIEKAFGPYFGFISNLLFTMSGVLMGAALVNGIADMLSVFLPAFNDFFIRALLFAILFFLFAYSHIRGIRQGMKVAKLLTIIKILPLILLVIAGLWKINTSNLQWKGFPTIDNLASASLILFSAYIGGETAMNVSGEMKNPKRTGPLGLILGVVSVILFYSLIQLTSQNVLGSSLSDQRSPLSAVAGSIAGAWGTRVLFIVGLVSIFGSLYTGILVYSRVIFAGANAGQLPKYLSVVHPKFATPDKSLIVLVALAFFLAISGGFRQLTILGSTSLLLLFVGVVLAVIKFRLSDEKKHPSSFKLPGGIIIPSVTFLVLAWFLSHSTAEEIRAMVVFVAVSSVIYLLKKKMKKGTKQVTGTTTSFARMEDDHLR